MKKLRHVIRAEQLVDPVLLDELFTSASATRAQGQSERVRASVTRADSSNDVL